MCSIPAMADGNQIILKNDFEHDPWRCSNLRPRRSDNTQVCKGGTLLVSVRCMSDRRQILELAGATLKTALCEFPLSFRHVFEPSFPQ